MYGDDGDDDGDANKLMVPGPSDEESDTGDRSGAHDATVAPYWLIDSSGVLHTPDDLFDQLLFEIIKEIEARDNLTRAPGERAARALCLFDTIAAIGIYMPEDIPLMLFAPALARTRFDAEFDSEFNPPDPQLASTWDQVEYIAERLDVDPGWFYMQYVVNEEGPEARTTQRTILLRDAARASNLAPSSGNATRRRNKKRSRLAGSDAESVVSSSSKRRALPAALPSGAAARPAPPTHAAEDPRARVIDMDMS